MPVKLVEVLRSNIVESVHKGDIAVVTAKGEILYEVGNPERITFFRSASKPFQTIAALEMGIVEEFKLDLKEIAIFTSSHSGEKEHIDILEKIMMKAGINRKDLQCGVHEPINKEAARELALAGQKPSSLHCNCSGKHVAMILALKASGMESEGYYASESEIQKRIDILISEFSDTNTENIIKAIDGCGMPVHGVPLTKMAYAFANLSNLNFMKGKYKKSQNYVISAMTMYPEMVAGNGRLDTELMKAFGDRIVCKIGAEGVFCVSLLGKAVGIALKIDDGNSRAVGPAIIEVLLQIGVINKNEIQPLQEFYNPRILNHKGEEVGAIKSVFRIE
jgi:L-asparaginase II